MDKPSNARGSRERGQLVLDLDVQRQAFAAYNEWAVHPRSRGRTKFYETHPMGLLKSWFAPQRLEWAAWETEVLPRGRIRR